MACEVYYFMLMDLILVCWYGLLAAPSESLYDCCTYSIVDAVLCYCKRLLLLLATILFDGYLDMRCAGFVAVVFSASLAALCLSLLLAAAFVVFFIMFY